MGDDKEPADLAQHVYDDFNWSPPARSSVPASHDAAARLLAAPSDASREAREAQQAAFLEQEAKQAEAQRELELVLDELQPVLSRLISRLPFTIRDGRHKSNPRVWTLTRIEAWFRERGVLARVSMDGAHISLEGARLIDPARPRCPECAGDLGGLEPGRVETHKPGCPRAKRVPADRSAST